LAAGPQDKVLGEVSSSPVASAATGMDGFIDFHRVRNVASNEELRHPITVATVPDAFIQSPAMDRSSTGVLPSVLLVRVSPPAQMDLRKAADSSKSVTLSYPGCSMVKSYSLDNGLPGRPLKKDDLKRSDNINLSLLAAGCSVGHGTDLHDHPISYMTLVVNGQVYDMHAESGNWFKVQIPMSVWASATHMELKQ
jgi:hypothetical protein